MSAERHALNAALEYAAKLERQLKEAQEEANEQRMRTSDLRRQLNAVKHAVGDRDRPTSEMSMQSNEAQFASAKAQPGYDPTEACPRCPHCGAPV